LIKTYSQALDYIYSFVDYSLTRNLRYSPEKFDLKRMRVFLELLNNPQQNYKVIHVAGTKGKGSTGAMIASILSSNGYKTGFYTSPHMIDFSERIRIGDDLISHQEIVDYINKLEPVIKKVPDLTTFEIITGLAFMFFSDRRVDFGVIEVGMGGRFDATNVVKPLLSVITSISYDHMKVLGKTLKKIAFEKAGIIKKGIPVVVSKQKSSPLNEIKIIARERQARLIYAPDLYKVETGSYSLEGQSFMLRTNKEILTNISIPLLGDHQINNAVTTFACIEELRSQGVDISSDAVSKGFKNINWPGRFEVINWNPLIIIDGAHNLDSFRKLADTIKKYLPEKQVIFIFGASEDKAAESMLGIIRPVVKTLIITRSEHPRAMELNKIESIAKYLDIPYMTEGNIKNAIGEALVRCDDMTAIVAAGSIFIAGAVKENFKG
jgi:dihydrofolate synthase/folylpolyglutamate synthase